MKQILNEEIHLYIDKKTRKTYYYDGTKLVEINPDAIKDAEEKERQAQDVTKETEQGKQERISKAAAKLSDEKAISTGLSKARAANYRSRQAQRQKEKEASADVSGYSNSSINKIKLSLNDFIRKEIKQKTNQSYSKFNKKYNNLTGTVIKPGKYKEQQKNVPTINVYFDQSGSWGASDIELGNDIISVLADYQRKKQIKINVYYFANDVTTYPPGGGGTDARPVMNHILSTQPDNVIIMTDSDTSSQTLPKATVPGGVWFIWKHGLRSDALANSLAGNKLTKEFNLE